MESPGKRRKRQRKDREGLLFPDVRDQTRLIVQFLNSLDDKGRKLGNARVGIYAFYDFDGAAIYVGQTREKMRTRIRRHLTNKRTDAVAMKVLDPMEVAEIEAWPLWEFQTRPKTTPKKQWDKIIKATLDSAEYTVYLELKARHGSISDLLNEKMPPMSPKITLPQSHRDKIVVEASRDRLYHPDERIARRAGTIAALAQIVKERDVSIGLRHTLVTQAERLQRLASKRYEEFKKAVPPEEFQRETVGSEEVNGGQDVSK
jgi:hypothetical protein